MADLTINTDLASQILTGFLKSEVTRVGFTRAVINLSGGLDSALSCVLAAQALGAENVLALRLPYRTSSPDSLDHAQLMIDQFKIRSETIDISEMVDPLVSRDPTISYRIGTRGYAWRNHLNVFGSHGHLEQDRDYKLVEIDAKLRSQERGGTSIYPEFANDVFLRRLRYSASPGSARAKAARISDALGRSLAPKDEAIELAGKDPTAVLRIDADWPSKLVDDLRLLASSDPLSAKLGEVWYRQKGLVSFDDHRPWEDRSKLYWRKERVELVLLQIGSIRKQRAIYGGEDDILGLSGGNILLFLSLCQYIWDYASQACSRKDGQPDLPIPTSIQTIGVFQTARTWLDRIPSDYGRSDDRYKLIQLLGW